MNPERNIIPIRTAEIRRMPDRQPDPQAIVASPMAAPVVQAARHVLELGPCEECGADVGRTDKGLPFVCQCRLDAMTHREELKTRIDKRDRLLEKYDGALAAKLHRGKSLEALPKVYEHQAEALATLRRFRDQAHKHLPPGHGAFIFGDKGTGKSSLTRGLAGDLHEDGYFTIWLKAKQLVDRMWDAKDRPTIVRALEVADLVVIDELKYENENRHGAGILFTSIDARFEAKKSTILTSNFDLKALHRHYKYLFTKGADGESDEDANEMMERFFSRLLPPRYKRIEMRGPDIRALEAYDW